MTLVFVLAIIVGSASGDVGIFAAHSQHKTLRDCIAAAASPEVQEIGRPMVCVGVPVPVRRDV